MQSLTHQFLAFCRSKPADEGYNFADTCGCAFGQFLSATGICETPYVGGFTWGNAPGDKHPLPSAVAGALVGYPWTFGALTTRLEAALAEQVQS